MRTHVWSSFSLCNLYIFFYVKKYLELNYKKPKVIRTYEENQIIKPCLSTVELFYSHLKLHVKP